MGLRWAVATLLALSPASDVEAASAPAAGEVEAPLVRVLSETAEVRSGAGFSFRVVAVASRDDVLEMIERGKRGGWTRVRLETGITGWILSEQIELFADPDAAQRLGPLRRFGRKLRDEVLGPPNLLTARIGGSMSAGALGREGLFLVRPSVFVSPNVAVEAYLGPSVGREVNRGIFGLSGNLFLSPKIPFSVFVSLGGGAVLTRGKADALADGAWSYLASPGGGLWIIFKRGVGLRFDFRNHVLFRANDVASLREYSGAIAFTF